VAAGRSTTLHRSCMTEYNERGTPRAPAVCAQHAHRHSVWGSIPDKTFRPVPFCFFAPTPTRWAMKQPQPDEAAQCKADAISCDKQARAHASGTARPRKRPGRAALALCAPCKCASQCLSAQLLRGQAENTLRFSDPEPNTTLLPPPTPSIGVCLPQRRAGAPAALRRRRRQQAGCRLGQAVGRRRQIKARSGPQCGRGRAALARRDPVGALCRAACSARHRWAALVAAAGFLRRWSCCWGCGCTGPHGNCTAAVLTRRQLQRGWCAGSLRRPCSAGGDCCCIRRRLALVGAALRAPGGRGLAGAAAPSPRARRRRRRGRWRARLVSCLLMPVPGRRSRARSCSARRGAGGAAALVRSAGARAPCLRQTSLTRQLGAALIVSRACAWLCGTRSAPAFAGAPRVSHLQVGLLT